MYTILYIDESRHCNIFAYSYSVLHSLCCMLLLIIHYSILLMPHIRTWPVLAALLRGQPVAQRRGKKTRVFYKNTSFFLLFSPNVFRVVQKLSPAFRLRAP